MRSSERFKGMADRYASFRPAYPARLLETLADMIVRRPAPADGVVVDVGSGTGIFTRQLRELLPPGMPITGVEPAAEMRRKAMVPKTIGIAYRDGLAQNIPLEAGSARAVLAATAAHWFDRPAFYAEARRILMPSGLLAIVEYVRDEQHSPAAAAVVEFLARHGTGKAYSRPDYASELDSAVGFHDLLVYQEPVVLKLPPDQFIGLALSSSHARPVLEALGQEGAEAELRPIARRLTTTDGGIPFGYLFYLFAVRSGGRPAHT